MRNERNVVFLIIIFCFFYSHNVFGKTLTIVAHPGGTYDLPEILTDVNVIVKGSGTITSPFVLSGEKAHTRLLGSSTVQISGDNIQVENLDFYNNFISYNVTYKQAALLQIGNNLHNSINVKIKKCYFRYIGEFNDRDKYTQFFWIKITGENCKVDSCFFEGKQNRLPIIHIDSNGYIGSNDTVSNCIFKNVKPRKGEALEAIRIGLGKSRSDCKIINNKFLNYSGDSETISCKSNGVIVRDNIFIHCRSGVSLRLGDSCLILDNQFINTVWPIRISGIGHKIWNNIFDNPKYSSIAFMKGGGKSGYKPCDDISIKNNIFLGYFFVAIIEPKYGEIFPLNVALDSNYVYNKELYLVSGESSMKGLFSQKPMRRKKLANSIEINEYNVDSKILYSDPGILSRILRFEKLQKD